MKKIAIATAAALCLATPANAGTAIPGFLQMIWNNLDLQLNEQPVQPQQLYTFTGFVEDGTFYSNENNICWSVETQKGNIFQGDGSPCIDSIAIRGIGKGTCDALVATGEGLAPGLNTCTPYPP